MGFSVRLVWSRPSHLHRVESSGSPQCKCGWDVWLSVFPINAECLITAQCFFCSWGNSDRKCSPSSLSSRETKTFRQTQHLLIGTRYLSPNDHWCVRGRELYLYAHWIDKLWRECQVRSASGFLPLLTPRLFRDCIHIYDTDESVWSQKKPHFSTSPSVAFLDVWQGISQFFLILLLNHICK